MEPFTKLTSVVAALDRDDVDTDQIIPKQFLKRIERTGFGPFLFFDWRFLADGLPNPRFELNQPRYEGAEILVTGRNFGCGSSREHAPWALLDYGFRAIIAPSFADIFYNNCFENGILPVRLPEEQVRAITEKAQSTLGFTLTVDLEQQAVYGDEGLYYQFEIDAFSRHRLLNGLDSIGLTLEHEDAIAAYERAHPVAGM